MRSALDSISLDTWLRQNTVLPQVRTLFLSYLQPTFGSDGLDVSMLFFLWYIAGAGNETNVGTFERSSDTADGAQDSRFVLGSQIVPLRLAADLGDAVALNAPVRKIEQRASSGDGHQRPRTPCAPSGSSSRALRRWSWASTGPLSSRRAVSSCSSACRWVR